MNQMNERRSKKFDVYNNQSSQMYGGAYSERDKSNLAVDSTRGEVLTYEGEIFPTFFHADCGGRTRDATELWNIDIKPLASLKASTELLTTLEIIRLNSTELKIENKL